MMLEGEGRFANRPYRGGDGAGRRGRVKSVQRTPLRECWVDAGSGWSRPLRCVNPCQVRDFARSQGILAKRARRPTGRQCNRPILGGERRMAAQPLASEEDRELEGLVARRRQVIQMRTAEQ